MCVSEQAPRWITIFIGVLLSVSGLVSLLSLARKDIGSREKVLYPVLGVVTLALGLFMVLRPTLFNTLLLYLLAGLLILVGLLQAYTRIRMQRMGITINWATYLVPVLTIAAGIYVFLYPSEASSIPRAQRTRRTASRQSVPTSKPKTDTEPAGITLPE